MSLLELFVEVDDFCKTFEPWAASQQLPSQASGSKRGPKPVMSTSEVMTLVIHFHQQGYRNLKHYYQKHVCVPLQAEFPKLVSYGRFVEIVRHVALPMCAFLQSRIGRATGWRLSIASPWRCAITAGSADTECSGTLPHEARTRWAGFLASSFILWSAIPASS